ncbi:MAG: Flp pilus assembly complex ATPase component TadA, partial [Candidatus Eremiobacteraeota bacterium]|nr:Flp pilus assembly complex ATPase component TadA [Candidatus Eremiobacteraeota bacterium]
ELDFNRIDGGHGFRFHIYLERGCPAASIRRLRTDIPKLVELGLSGGAVENFLDTTEGGLMVLAGKPRCGKINTFAALINYINSQRRTRIITIEPMIQFWHNSQESTVIQRELGTDTRSFCQAVRQAVQQDPDILAVGGIPDRETAEVIIQAAAGGHLVLALLDGTSCVRALDELLSAFSGGDGRMHQLMGRVMKLLVCQHLVQRADGRGLIPAMEILECDDQVRAMISHGDLREVHQHMGARQMQTLGRHLSRMIEVGLVTREEAVKYVDESEIEVLPPSQLEIPTAEPAVDDETPLMSWL